MEKLSNKDSRPRLLVVGDSILDEYIFGSVQRISPEAPVPILNHSESEFRLGGAANVAANAAAFGVDVSLLGICGTDDSAEILISKLEEENIDPIMIRADQGKTILKKRMIADNQQLFRIDGEVKFDKGAADSARSLFKKVCKNYDLVVFSDYGKGTLVDHKDYIELCKNLNIPVLIDPKGGDFEKYIGATLITPNLREFEEIMGSSSSQEEFLSKVKSLKKQLKLQHIIVTLSSDGMVLVDEDKEVSFFKAEAKQVFDVSGAGDTVIAILASLMAQGEDVSKALNIANIGAGIAVSKVGTCVVTRAEVKRHMQLKSKLSPWKIDLDYLLQETLHYKDQGKTIVMTNGCFDLLHLGHLDFLERSKVMGDVLIVALNRDDSITRLKGASRPINDFESRAKILASLSFVDFVIGFDEDTPEKLYSQLLPHILVKGEDYIDSKVAGADAVIENGGRVEFIPLLEGYSSSKIIEKILSTSR